MTAIYSKTEILLNDGDKHIILIQYEVYLHKYFQNKTEKLMDTDFYEKLEISSINTGCMKILYFFHPFNTL